MYVNNMVCVNSQPLQWLSPTRVDLTDLAQPFVFTLLVCCVLCTCLGHWKEFPGKINNIFFYNHTHHLHHFFPTSPPTPVSSHPKTRGGRPGPTHLLSVSVSVCVFVFW